MRIHKDGSLSKIRCLKGHDVTVADNFPENYDSLTCDVCHIEYKLKGSSPTLMP